MSKRIRVPITCPDCKGSGVTILHPRKKSEHLLTTAMCSRCHGTGNIGYEKRMPAEKDATWAEHERREESCD